jgi:hypothetical protein
VRSLASYGLSARPLSAGISPDILHES